MIVNHDYDVVVIGGGPAGSAASTILADKGWKVLLLEKEKFPRYHIGESLLPYGYFVLEKIGMLPAMKESAFTRKYSVQFVSTDGSASIPFYFHTHLEHEAAQTWQVRREVFDQMLLDNARNHGVAVQEQVAVRDLVQQDRQVVGVIAQPKEGEPIEYRARMTIDASGRDALSMHKNGWRVKDPALNKMAVWTYYKGALRDPGIDEGATTVAYVPQKGWFWYIPQEDDIVSVGIVAEPSYLYRDGRDPQKIFQREINNNRWIHEHLTPGTQTGGYHHTGDYSYRSRFCALDGLVLIGDAFAFLDPVFSSGVFLALKTADLASEVVHQCLQDGDVSASRFSDYGETTCQGIEAMRSLVYAFYDQAFSFGKLIRKYPHLKGDVTDCLIGNVLIDFTEMQNAMAEFASLPKPLPHGRALVGSGIAG
ncbi:MAG: tryptophan 7-halogenase [Candidatus Omnitrophica bacterium]|nr:MAG: putative thiazole biosynthetic enzyme [Candidatus Hinthialibacteria bacterium OLB16]MBV6482546.1 putative thiazole biosynthetic enzyme [bacterium]MCC6731795.1 tryptophan 7-halogenase [Candidatus Omnitrophota bacterium]MCE7909354.1 NAD(P)/FAD-dependent oxidoreductase [Candidatus Omnitrophica bacterium COP1]MCK6497556.1 tryptophan 7-halogenase [bacterium]